MSDQALGAAAIMLQIELRGISAVARAHGNIYMNLPMRYTQNNLTSSLVPRTVVFTSMEPFHPLDDGTILESLSPREAVQVRRIVLFRPRVFMNKVSRPVAVVSGPRPRPFVPMRFPTSPF